MATTRRPAAGRTTAKTTADRSTAGTAARSRTKGTAKATGTPRLRITPLRLVCGVALVLAVFAAVDLGFIAFSAFVSEGDPAAEITGELGALLTYFTFYPAIAVAAITLLVGAFVVWRDPDAHRIGIAVVAISVASAAFVVLAFVPNALH